MDQPPRGKQLYSADEKQHHARTFLELRSHDPRFSYLNYAKMYGVPSSTLHRWVVLERIAIQQTKRGRH